jgi:hypothetical protein
MLIYISRHSIFTMTTRKELLAMTEMSSSDEEEFVTDAIIQRDELLRIMNEAQRLKHSESLLCQCRPTFVGVLIGIAIGIYLA